MNKRNQYIIISVVLLLVSVLGIGLPLIINTGSKSRILTVLVVAASSLVLVATLLTLLLTRGGQKSLADAYQGIEKKCLTAALIVTSAIVLSNGCMSVTRLGHHQRINDDKQMMYRQPGQFPGMPGNSQPTQPNNGDQNVPSTDSNQSSIPQAPSQNNDSNTNSQNSNSQAQDNQTQSNN